LNWLFWSFLSACFAAATAILAKLGVEGVDPNFATAVRTTVVVIFTWLIAYGASGRESFHVPSNRTWLFLALSGLATGLSWLCYFRALQLGPASRVIVAGILFLGEKFTWGKAVGGLLIVAGAIVVALG
jgi:transporter family protein